MKERIKQKLTSPVVWVAVIAQIAGVIALFRPDISDTFKAVALGLTECLTLFGILNNPNDKGAF